MGIENGMFWSEIGSGQVLRANPCKNQTLHGKVKKLKFAVLLHTGRL